MLGDSMKRRRGKAKPARPEPEPGSGRIPPFSWGRWLAAAVVVLAGSFLVGYLISTQLLFPVPETAGEGIPVPDLYGEQWAEAESTLQVLGLRLGEMRRVASMGTEPGRVLAQDPLPGQQLLPGAAVSLGVSDGPPELRVPPLVGLGETTAVELLEQLGFEAAVRQTRSEEFPAGVVTRADPRPGTAQQLPARVTLIVSSGSPDDIADTLRFGRGR